MRAPFARFLTVLSIAAATAVPAHAQLYDNGAPNTGFGNEFTRWIQAQDFSLGSGATLTAVRFWAFGLSSTGSEYAGSIAWQIYGDGGSRPGALLFSGSASPTVTANPGGSCCGASFQLDFALPNVALGAGTFWLGLHNGPLSGTDRRDFYWQPTAANATLRGWEDVAAFDGDWVENGREHAFQLYGTTAVIPEPATVVLLGSGLGLVGLVARRRRRAG